MTEPTGLLAKADQPSPRAVGGAWSRLRRASRRRRYRQAVLAYGFIFPCFLALITLMYYPALSALYHSLTAWDGFNPPRFVGPRNFALLLHDPIMLLSVQHILIWSIGSVAITLSVPLLVAEIIMHLKSPRSQYWYRVVFAIPMVVPVLVVLLVWGFIYDPNLGLLNAILKAIGLGAWQNTWLANPNLALYCLIFIGFPFAAGFHFLVYLAGLQTIPGEILDACRIDGSNAWQRFWNVDAPLIMGQIKLLLILSIIQTLQGINAPLVLTNGGPGYATYVPSLYMYFSAFQFNRYGYGMAIATVLFVVILILTLINLRFIRVTTEYEA